MKKLALALLAAGILALPLSAAPRPQEPKEVAVDGNLKALLSSDKVLTVMNQMSTRFDGALARVEIVELRSGGATYRFHYDPKTPNPLHQGVGYFDVELGFGVRMKPNVGKVGSPTLMR